MKLLDRLQKASIKQKIIVTVWLVTSFLWGRSLALREYYEGMILFYIPFAMLILAVPSYFLYKIGGDDKSDRLLKIEKQKINEKKDGINITSSVKDKKINRKIDWLFWWKIDSKEIKKQIDNYNSLKITSSYKGISALLILGSAVLTIIFSLLGMLDKDAIYGLFIYIPMAFLVYKGYKWAIFAMMILWTAEKAYSLITFSGNPVGNPVMAVIWWVIFMKPLYGAFKVEQIRAKNK